jgi:hypothetical protein
MEECPNCGHQEESCVIEAFGQCSYCEAGLSEDDCYHLDEPYIPEYADVPEKYQY